MKNATIADELSLLRVPASVKSGTLRKSSPKSGAAIAEAVTLSILHICSILSTILEHVKSAHIRCPSLQAFVQPLLNEIVVWIISLRGFRRARAFSFLAAWYLLFLRLVAPALDDR